MSTKYIHSADIARKIDSCAIHEHLIPSLLLMEHAAQSVVDIIKKEVLQNQLICVLSGPGNNGADGMAIARLLNHDGYTVYLHAPFEKSMSHDELIQFQMIQSLKIDYSQDIQETIKVLQEKPIIIDCLFGNGLSRNIEGNYQVLIENISPESTIYAVDIPSGIHATTGEIMNVATHANKTIALDCFKEGHWIYPGKEYCGELVCTDITIPECIHKRYTRSIYVNKELIQKLLPERNNHSHKGSFGKALMIGGSYQMPGALALATSACAHSGIGTLTIMEPDCIGDILFEKTNFAMHIRAKDKDGHFDKSACDILEKNINNYDIVSIGNGMGRNDETKALVKKVLESNKTIILDADAIWAIQDSANLLKREAMTIITPHVKEMTYLCNKTTQEILKNPFNTTREFIQNYPNCTLLLKSDICYIASKEKEYLYSNPNSSLAKGGSGDVLCGILTGLAASKIHAADAAACACYIQNACASQDIDSAVIGPDDLVNQLDTVFKSLRK